MANNDQIFDDKSRADMPADLYQPQSSSNRFFQNKGFIYSVIAVVVVLLLGGYLFLMSQKPTQPTSNNVTLLIKGPDQIMSGNEGEFHITYHNGENADLVDVSLQMFYPSGFKFKSADPEPKSSEGAVYNLPVLKKGQDAEVIIRGKLSGFTGEDKVIKASLHYKLSNFNSEFSVEQILHSSILPPNLVMDVNGPVDVVKGQDTTFTVNFTNVTNQDFDNLALQVTYPEGFSFTSSKPAVSKGNNYWTIPKLAKNTSQSIDITGSFNGNDPETKLVKADLGQIINGTFAPQLTSTATFKIIPSALSINLSSDAKDGVVKLGDNINYKLDYVNQGPIGLNNLVVVVNLDGVAVDYSRINASDAIITGHTLTWKAATLPGLSVLSPNEKGSISFNVPLVQNLTTNLKNQIIKATTAISSDESPKATHATDVVLKLGSELDLTVNGDYVSGAAPMEVGKSTLFAMTFLLSNLSNDLSNTKVVASLPLPASAWKNVIIPDAEKNRLSYDPNSGRITWNIGDLAAFTGKFIPALKVTFQLEVTPTEVDRNKTMDLLSNIQATGTDTFTNKDIHTDIVNDISVSDIDDDVMNTKGTSVK